MQDDLNMAFECTNMIILIIYIYIYLCVYYNKFAVNITILGQIHKQINIGGETMFINKSAFVQNTRAKSVYSDCKVEGDMLTGKLWLADEETGLRRCIEEVEGDYDNVQAANFNDCFYVAYTCYKDGCRDIFLSAHKDGERLWNVVLLEKAKLDNVFMTMHEERLYIAFEELVDGNAETGMFICDPATGQPYVHINPTPGETAYKPKLLSCGGVLYMAYEAFYAGRYHILTRILKSTTESFYTFSQGFEIGFDTLNDQSVHLQAYNGRVLASWENSSPLFKNYVWQPPNRTDEVNYIPSFGHGWRIESKMGLRELFYDGEALNVSSLDGWNSPLVFSADDSAGEISALEINGTLFLLYLDYDNKKNYKVTLKYYKDGLFIDTNIPDIRLDSRKRPTFTLVDGTLYVIQDNPYEQYKCHKINLAEYSSQPPVFKISKSIKLDELVKTPRDSKDAKIHTDINGDYQLLWGDLHMHSNISPCSKNRGFHCSDVSDKLRFSKDVGGLDFCLLTDHEIMTDYEWALTKKAADFINKNNVFTGFLGYEWTASHRGEHRYGHYNVLYKNSGKLYRIRKADSEKEQFGGLCSNINDLWATLGEAITIPHHPGDSQHTLDWDFFNEQMEPLVEIYQVRGSYEHDGCEYDPVKLGRGVVSNNSVQAGLNRGYKFGFTAGGEHEGVGLTAVFAKDHSREAIFEALKARRVYGTTSAKIFLTFFVNSVFMGGETKHAETFNINGHVNGADFLRYISVVTNNGELMTEFTSLNKEATYSFVIDKNSELFNGLKWVYIRIKQTNGDIAWSSPVFID